MKIRYMLLMACVVASVTAVAGPVARWKSVTHDFGAFDEDMGKVTSDFVVFNDGDAPMMIYAHVRHAAVRSRISHPTL